MLPRELKLSSHNNNGSGFHPICLIGIDLLIIYVYVLDVSALQGLFGFLS